MKTKDLAEIKIHQVNQKTNRKTNGDIGLKKKTNESKNYRITTDIFCCDRDGTAKEMDFGRMRLLRSGK